MKKGSFKVCSKAGDQNCVCCRTLDNSVALGNTGDIFVPVSVAGGLFVLKTLVAVAFAGLTVVMPASAADITHLLKRINLKPGFKISVFAEMPKPRQMKFSGPKGIVFIGSRLGNVYSAVDRDGDGFAEEVKLRASGLNGANGVAIQDGKLYIGQQEKIVRWAKPAESDTSLSLAPLITINTQLNSNPWHGWRTIHFGPDRKLYVAVGAPCNICELEANTGKIVRMNADGSGWEVVADGVRNSVGFDWNPITGQLWFTDNGADGMGDDTPPDELNRVTKPGQNFGFPYLGGKSDKLTGYENQTPPVKVTPPEIEFGAHTANLGMDFYTGTMFPAEYKNDAFVAQHGSWNRTVPAGYRIMRIKFDDAGNAIGKEVFADGWLDDSTGKAFGRPVDIEELPDGSILVSDDFANVIYRISYEK